MKIFSDRLFDVIIFLSENIKCVLNAFKRKKNKYVLFIVLTVDYFLLLQRQKPLSRVFKRRRPTKLFKF